MLIYKLTFASGKFYIGQTKKAVEQRYRVHAKNAKAGSPLPVHAAWREHGAPTVEIVAVCDSLEALNQAEIEAIATARCRVPNGYNLSGGGGNQMVHPATCAKLSSRIVGDEWRASMSAAAKARKREPWSEETKAKMAASAKAHYERTADNRSEKIRAGIAARSPEDRSMSARKAWATKRAQGN